MMGLRLSVTTVLQDDLAWKWAVFMDSIGRPPTAEVLRKAVDLFLDQAEDADVKYREALARSRRKNLELIK